MDKGTQVHFDAIKSQIELARTSLSDLQFQTLCDELSELIDPADEEEEDDSEEEDEDE